MIGSGTLALGWDAVKAGAFARFDETEFEGLCRELLEIEKRERHAPDAVLEGPPPPKGSGADLRFELKSPPRLSVTVYSTKYGPALTPDELGVTVYSCKTGRSWEQELLRDAREGSEWAAAALGCGGRFVALVNIPRVRRAARKATPKTGARVKVSTAPQRTSSGGQSPSLEALLAEAYGSRTGEDPGDLITRIRVIDANDLRELVRAWKPESLSSLYRDKLGVAVIPGLLSLEGWAAYHGRERGEPVFEWDEARTQLRAQIVSALNAESDDPYGRTIWLIGPPGVGKTRLVLETLNGDPLCQERSRVATSPAQARVVLSEHALHRGHPNAILVVDDCPVNGVEDLLKGVAEHNRHGQGGMIVLTPIAPDVQAAASPSGIRRLDLERLDDKAARRMIARELGDGASDSDVEVFARFTGGYPWFAALVAKEVKGGAPPPKSREQAAQMAICSKEHESDWVAEVWIRARTLMLVMLTEDIDWASLDDAERQSLCSAVGLDRWSQAENARQRCVERGILRIRGKYKYVTPALLEQVVAEMLLNPRPDGPDRLGPRLEKHARPYLRRFYQRLTELGLSREALEALAAPILRTLDTGPAGLQTLGREGVSGAELMFASRCLPGPVARVLRRLLEGTNEDVLRQRTDVRRDLVFCLEFAVRTSAGFEDAEAALLRLALAENEAWGNNATGIWTGLFSVEGHMTYRTWRERLDLLKARSEDPRTAVRRLAVNGLQAAISIHGYRMGGGEVEGPYPIPDPFESRTARIEAWRLLANRARDAEQAVAERARAIFIEELRGAVRSGIAFAVAGMLIPIVDSFPEAEMRRLRDELSRTVKYDWQYLEQTGAATVWQELLEAAAPRSFVDQLRLRAGSWLTEEEEHETEQRDLALAALGLEAPHLGLLAELPWLSSREAVRAVPFLIAAGRADGDHLLLGPLVRMAQDGSPDMLSAYLRGWKESGQEDAVDALLRTYRDDPALAEAVAMIIWRIGATEERINLMVELIRAGRLTERVFSALPIGSWEREASTESLGRLVLALLDSGEPSALSAALWLLVRRAGSPTEPPQRWQSLLITAMAAISVSPLEGMTAHQWKRGATILLESGETSRVLDFAVRALRPERGYRTPEEPWAILGKCAERDPRAVWRAIEPRLAGDPREASALATALSGTSIPARLPVSDVMSWVGTDADRALRVARMISMHEDGSLPRLARSLLVQFGPEAPSSRFLALQMRTTQQMVHSLAAFSASQAERTRGWTDDPDPHVRRWAKQLLAALERSRDTYTADEEYEERRWGT